MHATCRATALIPSTPDLLAPMLCEHLAGSTDCSAHPRAPEHAHAHTCTRGHHTCTRGLHTCTRGHHTPPWRAEGLLISSALQGTCVATVIMGNSTGPLSKPSPGARVCTVSPAWQASRSGSALCKGAPQTLTDSLCAQTLGDRVVSWRAAGVTGATIGAALTSPANLQSVSLRSETSRGCSELAHLPCPGPTLLS